MGDVFCLSEIGIKSLLWKVPPDPHSTSGSRRTPLIVRDREWGLRGLYYKYVTSSVFYLKPQFYLYPLLIEKKLCCCFRSPQRILKSSGFKILCAGVGSILFWRICDLWKLRVSGWAQNRTNESLTLNLCL